MMMKALLEKVGEVPDIEGEKSVHKLHRIGNPKL
jgi:hypothetical protein